MTESHKKMSENCIEREVERCNNTRMKTIKVPLCVWKRISHISAEVELPNWLIVGEAIVLWLEQHPEVKEKAFI